MDIRAAIVDFNSSKTCFITVPKAWVKDRKTKSSSQSQVITFEVNYSGGKTAYFSWAGETFQGTSDTIELNGLYADKLGIKYGSEVAVKSIHNVSVCSQICVEPLSCDDWEILELHAGYIESNLLNQVRVVWSGQILPLWVQKSTCIFVTVAKIEPPCSCAILQQLTEVIVSPKSRHHINSLSPVVPDIRDNSSVIKKSGVTSNEDNVNFEIPEKFGIVGELNRNNNAPLPKSRTPKKRPVSTKSPPVEPLSFWGAVELIKSFIPNRYIEFNAGEEIPKSNPELACSNIHLKVRVQSLKDSYVNYINIFRGIHKLPELEDIASIETDLAHDLSLAGQLTTVFVHESTLNEFDLILSEKAKLLQSFLAKITKLLSPIERFEKEQRKDKLKKLESLKDKSKTSVSDNYQDKTLETIVRVLIVKSQYNASDHMPLKIIPPKGQVYIHDVLRRKLGLDVTAQTVLQTIHYSNSEFTGVTFYPLFDVPGWFNKETLLLAVKIWLFGVSTSDKPVICTQGMLIKIFITKELEGEFIISFENDAKTDKSQELSGTSYYFLYPAVMNSVKIALQKKLAVANKPDVIDTLPYYTATEFDQPIPKEDLKYLGGITDIAKKATDYLSTCLTQAPLAFKLFHNAAGLCNGGLLISGPRGCGKTSFARALCREMTNYPNHVHIKIVECTTLRGKRVESIKSVWQKIFYEAAWRQPTLILLDDLDHVTPAASGPEQEMSGEAVYYGRIARVLMDLCTAEITHHSHVVVIATCKSQASLHPSVVSSRGSHYFQGQIEIKPPNLSQRTTILGTILKSKENVSHETLHSLNLDHVSAKTEGFVARDLVRLIDRALHAHYIQEKGVNTDQVINDEDFDHALVGFKPSSLQNIVLHKASELGWQDVGGLGDIKNTLVETLQWPSKYPTLFANCPLRLRSGILLYGAPGTGKTLLAGVVAKECGLNFISIKGPELLSKYIGASEQAVRDTFIRAQSAKPCILFFDEFDAIAPRRGHDSTGVTDRVVNQLLTQLDGVEGLEGVYVLGATSRPDLIDPALLRPGRLDKSICCPLPDEAERLEILHAVTRSVNLSDDVDLNVLAKQCNNFTGADFKALLYNAQLESIHEHTGYIYGAIGKDSQTTDDKIEQSNGVQIAVEKERLKNRDILYMPNLEEGVADISFEFEERLVLETSLFTSGVPKRKINKKAESASEAMEIHQSHLLNAAKNMGPSVSESERRRYQMIYKNFVSSRGGNFVNTQDTGEKRLTLA